MNRRKFFSIAGTVIAGSVLGVNKSNAIDCRTWFQKNGIQPFSGQLIDAATTAPPRSIWHGYMGNWDKVVAHTKNINGENILIPVKNIKL